MRYSAIAIFLFLLISCNDHSGKRSRTNGDNIDTVKKTAAYKMEISYANQITRAGKEITFKLRPVNIADKSIGILETIHEKKIHLIVVSTDLSYFRHLHPDADTGGKYSIRIAFPHGGHYLLFADYKAQGAIQKADTTGIDVAGDTVPATRQATTQPQKAGWCVHPPNPT